MVASVYFNRETSQGSKILLPGVFKCKNTILLTFGTTLAGESTYLLVNK